MRRTRSAALLLLALACADPGDEDAARATPSTTPATPAERVAAWRAARPAEPLPASLAFEGTLPDTAVAAFLTAHPVRATLAYVRSRGRIGVVDMDSALDPEAALAAVREETRAAARADVCASVARIRGMYGQGESQLTLPGGDLGRAHALLADARAALQAFQQLPAGGPLVWALEVSGPPAAVLAAAGDARVRGFEPAALETRSDGRRAVVPEPAPPATWRRADSATYTAPAATDEAGTEAEVRAGFDRLLAAARPLCPAAFR